MNPLDKIYQTLDDTLRKIATDFDLKYNRWCKPPNTVGRLYLNREDRTAACFIEENNSKHWIDKNIGSKLREAIEAAFNQYSEDYNAFYKKMEED